MNTAIDLVTIIDLYKKEKISDFSLCSEIERVVNNSIRTTVTLTEGNNNGGSKNFLVSVLPIKFEKGIKAELIIDKAFAKGTSFSNEEISNTIKSVANEIAPIVSSFNKSFKLEEGKERGVKDILPHFFRAFESSMKAINPEIVERAGFSDSSEYWNSLPLSDSKLDEVVAYININKLLPKEFVERAKKLNNKEDFFDMSMDEKPEFISFTLKKQEFDKEKHHPLKTSEVPDNYTAPGWKHS